MNRRAFGTWGANLDEDAFAQALAALGVGGHSAPLHGDNIQSAIIAALASDPVEFALGLNVDWVIQWNRWPRQLATPPEKADVFSRAWQNAIKSRYGDLRLEIQPSGHRRLGV